MVAALFPAMADTIVSQLDALYVSLTVLTLLHAASKRGLWAGSAVVACHIAHAALLEHMSLFLGGTHCHATSPLLPMVSPCSSINSLLFYVPWTYTSIEAARRLDLRPAAFPFAVGLLQIGFGAVYEMQGPTNGYWNWPDEGGVIANSPELKPWDGYPPVLHEAKRQREVATIVDGVFRVSHHAGVALAERVFQIPVLAMYYHFAYGFGWAMGLLLTGHVDSLGHPSPPRLFVAGLLSLVLFLPPIWATQALSEAAGLPLVQGVPFSLAVSVLPVAIFGRAAGSTAAAAPSPAGPDGLLFLISLGMQAFFLTLPWRTSRSTPQALVALVAVTAALHLAAQSYCCFGVHSRAGAPRRGERQKKAL